MVGVKAVREAPSLPLAPRMGGDAAHVKVPQQRELAEERKVCNVLPQTNCWGHPQLFVCLYAELLLYILFAVRQ